MNATTVTLYVHRLRECCLMDGTADELAMFDASLPAYVERLTAALPAGVTLEIDETNTGSVRSVGDNADQSLADELGDIEFWA